MLELRTDWLTGRTVIIAEDRANRPNEFAAAMASGDDADASAASVESCPFCPGHESLAPQPVYQAVGADRRWRLRVVPNKFPVLTLEAQAAAGGVAAVGAHEVVIESARHIFRMSELTVPELAEVLGAYAARLAHWHQSGRFAYGLVFKNVGPGAGASLAHLHSQLVALPTMPPLVAAEFGRAEQHYRQQQHCPYCQLIDQERAAGRRVVLDRDGLIAFCPFASRQAGEVWLLPVEHQAWFEQQQPAAADRLAATLHGLVSRLEAMLPYPAYNLLLHTAPWQSSAERCGHWRIELLPRVAGLAGFELATGIHINPLSPSRAAETLRSS